MAAFDSADVETNAARCSICSAVSRSRYDGMTPLPFVTTSTTSRGVRLRVVEARPDRALGAGGGEDVAGAAARGGVDGLPRRDRRRRDVDGGRRSPSPPPDDRLCPTSTPPAKAKTANASAKSTAGSFDAGGCAARAARAGSTGGGAASGPRFAKPNSSAWTWRSGSPCATSCARRFTIIAGGPQISTSDEARSAFSAARRSARQEPVAVARDDGDLEVVAPRRDRAELVEEVRLLGPLDAVVEVDGRPVAVAEAARHAEERRHADPAGRPDLPRLREADVRERAERPLDDRLRALLEPAQRARVVADRLHGDPQRPLAGRGRDRERVELVADLAGADREHLPLQRDVDRALARAQLGERKLTKTNCPGR